MQLFSQLLFLQLSSYYSNTEAIFLDYSGNIPDECYHLWVLQCPQVNQVKVTWQRGAKRHEGAELRQWVVTRGNHGDWRVTERKRGQVGEQRQVAYRSSAHFLSETKKSQ